MKHDKIIKDDEKAGAVSYSELSLSLSLSLSPLSCDALHLALDVTEDSAVHVLRLPTHKHHHEWDHPVQEQPVNGHELVVGPWTAFKGPIHVDLRKKVKKIQ